jgi:monoamine oxidase
MKLTSYWLDTSQPFDRGSSKPLEGRYDVAVVGGGLTGSSAALALAKKGARVAVLEAETVGNAASGRNGGMCNNGFAQNYAVMAGKYGKEAANALYKAFDAGVDMVERLVRKKGSTAASPASASSSLPPSPSTTTCWRAARSSWRPMSIPRRG